MNGRILCTALTIGLIFFLGNTHAQTFSCDNSLYLTQVPPGERHSALISANQDDGGRWVFEELNADLGHVVYPIGYRVQDNYIYGLTQPDLKLVRINAEGELTELASMVERGLDTAIFDFVAGDVVPGGHTFFLVAQEKETGIAKAIFNIQLRPNYRVGLMAFTSFTQMQVDDLAHDPVYGSINTFDRKSQQVVILGQGGNANNYFSVKTSGVGQLSAVFFDKNGVLKGIGKKAGNDGNDNLLFEFNKFNGKLLNTVEIPGGNLTAGCSCPYSIDYFKEITPDTSSGCESLRLKYQFINKMGTGQGNIILRDTLSRDLKITSILRQHFLSTVNFDESTGILEVMMREIVLGSDSLVLEVETERTDFESWKTRASLGPFPIGVGITQYSDNPRTDVPGDATLLTSSALTLSIPESYFICEDSVWIEPVVKPAHSRLRYLWNTGDSTMQISVSQAGWYTLTISNDCQVLSDSVFVEQSSFPVSVDLGPDQTVVQGQRSYLSFTTNASGPYQLSWKTDEDVSLDCQDCEQPQAIFLDTTIVTLTLQDVNGCLVEDTIRINVEKPRQLQVSNVFSPNGDGINDYFYIRGRVLANYRHFRIVDRWGNVAFDRIHGQVNNEQHGWDGYRNGNQVEQGVYYYSVDIVFPDGEIQNKTGNVMLVR